MRRAEPGRVRVAVLGADVGKRARLRAALGRAGVEVITSCRLSAFSRSLAGGADALLVLLEGADDTELDALDQVAGERVEPMVFAPSAALDTVAIAALREKLIAAVAESRWAKPMTPRFAAPVDDDGFAVWVLGASFGGPQTLKRFLATLPEAPAAAFVIAQHLGEGFVELLAEQLHRVAAFPVVCAAQGLALNPGRAYVAPVGLQLGIDRRHRFTLQPARGGRGVYAPAIDGVMKAVAARYGPRSGAIVFSGMGDDGSLGCRAIAAAGGAVWAQDPATCTVDSMPARAITTGTVTRVGSPEQLAQQWCGTYAEDSTGERLHAAASAGNE